MRVNVIHPVRLARILPPPEVVYRGKGNGEVVEHVAVGKWAIRNRFYTSPPVNRWGMLYFGPNPQNHIVGILNEFQNQLPPVRNPLLLSGSHA